MSGERILVVDDEAANRRLLGEILSPLGYVVSQAADGDEALAAVSNQPPDLILLDVMMPRLDGYAVCRAVKGDPRTRLVPIIMLTSLDQLPDKIKAVDIGVDEFLTKPFNVVELTTRVRSLLSMKRFTDELEHASKVLEGFGLLVESRDRYTGNHCHRLGEYAARVGVELGLGEEDLRILRLGGVFHDLGKIAVPDAILNKPDRLTESETHLMRIHPVMGSDLCKGMRTLERVLPLIRHHHERLDGSGYPDGLKGDQIPLLVRIISVADVYDALATRRSYKEPLPRETCIRILREEADRGWWDRTVVETLGKIVTSGVTAGRP